MRTRHLVSGYKIERWRDVFDFKGYYRISDWGSLKSLSRLMWNGNSYWRSKEKIMELKVGTDGYYTVRLAKEGKRYDRRIHILVAMAFCEHIPNGSVCIAHHKDERRLNNYYKNLGSESIRSNTSISMLNKKKSSSYTGVHLDTSTGKWISIIRYEGKKHYLGTFKIEKDAGDKYQEALAHINGGDFKEWLIKIRLVFESNSWNYKKDQSQAA